MDKKLTLSLNEGVIENAKKYAKSHKISLSKLIEAYLQSISRNTSKEFEITPLVESLSGVIHLPSDTDSRDDYRDFLTEKYK